jgi:ubiquinone biosynthesis protein COQ9
MSQRTDWATAAEQRLLTAAVRYAPRLGWTSRLVAASAAEAGLTEGEAELLLPHGPSDLAALLAERHDVRALDALAAWDAHAMKVRDRIRTAVLARCEAAMRDEAAVRRWSGFLALPSHAPLALRLLWRSADRLWRWAGDIATDENHYTKRVLLAEILVSTLAVRLASGPAAAEMHLDRRIEAVMAFEKWKAGAGPRGLGGRLAARLGRMRYGAAGAPREGRP